jgi:gamma-butyrobetaine dioxygenase
MYIATIEAPHLRISVSGRPDRVFHAVWLYENSSLAMDSSTQQRMEHAFDYPLDLAVVSARVDVRHLELSFSDGRRGTIALDALLQSRAHATGFRGLPVPVTCWNAATDLPPPVKFDDFRYDASARLDVMSQLARFGCAFLDGVPAVRGGMLDLTRLIGPIKETNFGTIEDVRVILNPADLTLTSRGIEQHTDNPYRWPAPGLYVAALPEQ